MKHLKFLVIAGIIGAMAMPARAEEFQKCTKDFQTCINELAKQLQKRGWIGFSLSQIDGKIVVAGTAQEGPARKAGFEPGDVIVSLNGTKYDNVKELAKAHAQFKVGDILSYKVVRDGKEQELDVLLTEATSGIIGLWMGEHIVEHYLTVDKDMVKVP
jgi:S1-C subfamily serine protease